MKDRETVRATEPIALVADLEHILKTCAIVKEGKQYLYVCPTCFGVLLPNKKSVYITDWQKGYAYAIASTSPEYNIVYKDKCARCVSTEASDGRQS